MMKYLMPIWLAFSLRPILLHCLSRKERNGRILAKKEKAVKLGKNILSFLTNILPRFFISFLYLISLGQKSGRLSSMSCKSLPLLNFKDLATLVVISTISFWRPSFFLPLEQIIDVHFDFDTLPLPYMGKVKKKHRHRRNVTSHHSFSLLWQS